MSSNKGFIPYNQNQSVYFQEWTCSEPVAAVLMVHGFAEHIGRYDELAQFFNSHHIDFLGYDHPGHGKTEGKKGHADSYEQLLDALEASLEKLRKQHPSLPLIIYGHSMGGNIALNFLFKRNPKIDAVITTGSWIHLYKPAPGIKVAIGKMLRNILPKMTQPTDLDESLLSTDLEVGKRYLADPLVQTRISNALGIDLLMGAKFLADLKTSTSVPLLLMHGEKDQVIHPKGTIALKNQISGNVDLKIWEGMYHEIHNEVKRHEVLDYTYNWINQNVLNKK